MNLVWIIIILAALAVSVGLFLVAGGIILYFTRRRKWWVRALLVCVPGIALWLLWDAWLGPHEMTDEKALADRFQLVFLIPPAPLATDIHYQIADGPDDMGEWFRFRMEGGALTRLSPDLKPATSREFGEAGSGNPRWWLAEQGAGIVYYKGTIPTVPGKSPHSRQAWIAHDPAKQLVYCYIHSLL